jgi:hypothetical protein
VVVKVSLRRIRSDRVVQAKKKSRNKLMQCQTERKREEWQHTSLPRIISVTGTQNPFPERYLYPRQHSMLKNPLGR